MVTFIIYIGNTLYLLRLDKLRNFFNHLPFIHYIRDLGNNNNLPSTIRDFNIGFPSNYNSPSTGFKSILYPLIPLDYTSGGEIGTFNILHQLFDSNLIVINIGTNCIYHLRKIMRSHICSHPDSNTGRTIKKQKGCLCREHGGFLQRIIKIVLKINSILLQIFETLLGYFAKTRLCITHCGSRVSINGTEVPLPLYQHIPHIPFLSHPHHCLINR